MVSITPQISSEYVVKLKELHTSDLSSRSRRVSRTATLDGGSVTVDSGYTDTDRTLVIDARVTKSVQEDLEYMLENYTLLNVATNGECLSCAPKNIKCNNGALRLVLLVTE